MSGINRKYTNINFEQVLSDLRNILSSKEGNLADFTESSYGRTLMELFAANSDLNANWIESAFRESFLQTATTSPSIYAGARMLGYSIRRAIPAKAGFGLSLKRTGKSPFIRVSIPKGTLFQGSGVSLYVMEDVEFIYDRNDSSFSNGLMKLVSGRAIVLQGNKSTQRFFSDGQQNQEFIVNDNTFSDYFGNSDPTYTGNELQKQLENLFTSVSSDATLTENVESIVGSADRIFWKISRRGLHDPKNKTSVNNIDNWKDSVNTTTNYTVLLETGNDGRVRLKFGDGITSAIPFGLIDVNYFSTLGTNGNRVNVAGSIMQLTSDSGILITGVNGSESDLVVGDINFAITTDILGGLDIESQISIKNNSSQVFNSLDSLNNKSSYNTFLKRYTDIVYSNVYGEQELNALNGNVNAKYSNVVRYTALRDLYRNRDGKIYPTEPFEYYLQGYKVNGLTYLWQYDYADMKNSIELKNQLTYVDSIVTKMNNDGVVISKDGNTLAPQILVAEYFTNFPTIPLVPDNIFSTNLNPMDWLEVGSELETLTENLNRRGYITLGGGQTYYVPPIVHDMTIKMDVILFQGSNFSDIKTKITNAIYTYLKDYTNFKQVIYRSRVESEVQSFVEVAGVNLRFDTLYNDYSGLDLTSLKWFSENTAQYIDMGTLSATNTVINFSLTVNNIDNNFTMDSQIDMSNKIDAYYKNYIAVKQGTGEYAIRANLTESDINKFTSYIWSLMLNNNYIPIYNEMRTNYINGNTTEAIYLYNILEAICGWYLGDGILKFKDTEYIKSMVSDSTLYEYFVYALEYIKLVRNILNPIVALSLIDDSGNISKYSNDNEIVQFRINSQNINVTVGGK